MFFGCTKLEAALDSRDSAQQKFMSYFIESSRYWTCFPLLQAFHIVRGRRYAWQTDTELQKRHNYVNKDAKLRYASLYLKRIASNAHKSNGWKIWCDSATLYPWDEQEVTRIYTSRYVVQNFSPGWLVSALRVHANLHTHTKIHLWKWSIGRRNFTQKLKLKS